jgi:hypothetical protein
VATVEEGVKLVAEGEELVEAELAVLVGAREEDKAFLRMGVGVLRIQALAEDTMPTQEALPNTTAAQTLRRNNGISLLPRCRRIYRLRLMGSAYPT